MQVLGDREPDVEADEIRELQRAHRMVVAQLHRLVDVFRGGAFATARSTAAGAARACVTTSTNFIACTGLNKCVPTTRPGSCTAAAMSVIESDELLVASRCSCTASMTAERGCARR